jgi:hypothetical protein
MTVGFNNLQTCLPKSDGRAFDAGCFMRFSERPFFADNQTIDITPYLKGWIRTLLFHCFWMNAYLNTNIYNNSIYVNVSLKNSTLFENDVNFFAALQEIQARSGQL